MYVHTHARTCDSCVKLRARAHTHTHARTHTISLLLSIILLTDSKTHTVKPSGKCVASERIRGKDNEGGHSHANNFRRCSQGRHHHGRHCPGCSWCGYRLKITRLLPPKDAALFAAGGHIHNHTYVGLHNLTYLPLTNAPTCIRRYTYTHTSTYTHTHTHTHTHCG